MIWWTQSHLAEFRREPEPAIYEKDWKGWNTMNTKHMFWLSTINIQLWMIIICCNYPLFVSVCWGTSASSSAFSRCLLCLWLWITCLERSSWGNRSFCASCICECLLAPSRSSPDSARLIQIVHSVILWNCFLCEMLCLICPWPRTSLNRFYQVSVFVPAFWAWAFPECVARVLF